MSNIIHARCALCNRELILELGKPIHPVLNPTGVIVKKYCGCDDVTKAIEEVARWYPAVNAMLERARKQMEKISGNTS